MGFGATPTDDPYESGWGGWSSGGGGGGAAWDYRPGIAVDLLRHERPGLFNTEIFFDSERFANRPRGLFEAEEAANSSQETNPQSGQLTADTSAPEPAASSNLPWIALTIAALIWVATK